MTLDRNPHIGGRAQQISIRAGAPSTQGTGVHEGIQEEGRCATDSGPHSIDGTAQQIAIKAAVAGTQAEGAHDDGTV